MRIYHTWPTQFSSQILLRGPFLLKVMDGCNCASFSDDLVRLVCKWLVSFLLCVRSVHGSEQSPAALVLLLSITVGRAGVVRNPMCEVGFFVMCLTVELAAVRGAVCPTASAGIPDTPGCQVANVCTSEFPGGPRQQHLLWRDSVLRRTSTRC